MSRRFVLAGSLLLATAVAVPVGAAVSSPVTVVVRHDSHGVGVGTSFGHQPLVGAGTYDGNVCAGFSYEVPFCIETVQR